MAEGSSVSDLKIPPHSIEAEQSVLGGLMLNNQAWDSVSDKVQELDFYRFEHRIIFRAIHELASALHPVDVLTLTERLKSTNDLDNAGGEIYLYQLANNTPSVANIDAYAQIVRARSVLRQLISTANEIAETAFNPLGREITDILDEAERKVFAIAEQTSAGAGPVNIKDLLAKATRRIDELFQSKKAVTGMSTGFTDLDAMTSGLQPADLIIVAGRPSMGKTILGINMAESAALSGSSLPVLVFSLEMPGDAIAMRSISSLGRINQHLLRTGQLEDADWPRLSSAVNLLSGAPLFVDDTPGISPGEVRARARRIAREHGQLGLIVVDYLQLMRVPGYSSDNRVGEISEISRSLKALAKEMNVPVVALSQLNRSLESRADRRPMMSDLRESGAIEQDADIIIFIYRDEVYHEDSPDKGTAEIIIAKQRNGPIGKVRLAFFGQFTRFEDLAHQSYQPAGGVKIGAMSEFE